MFLGIGLGGVLGGGLFQLFGYFWLFATFGFLMLLSALLVNSFPQTDTSLLLKQKQSLGRCKILCVPRTRMGLLNIALSLILYYSLEPTLALKLQSSFHYNSFIVSLYMGLFCLGILTGIALLLLIPENHDKRPYIILGSAVLAFGALFVGPSKILHLPDYSSIIASGLFIGGLGRGVITGFSLT